MKFTATFAAKDKLSDFSSQNTFSIDQMHEGLITLRNIRTIFQNETIPAESVYRLEKDKLPAYSTVELNEAQAIESGLFEEDSEVLVYIPTKFLDKFLHDEFETTDYGIRLFLRVDYDGILDAWSKAGYPVEWGFDATDKE